MYEDEYYEEETSGEEGAAREADSEADSENSENTREAEEAGQLPQPGGDTEQEYDDEYNEIESESEYKTNNEEYDGSDIEDGLPDDEFDDLAEDENNEVKKANQAESKGVTEQPIVEDYEDYEHMSETEDDYKPDKVEEYEEEDVENENDSAEEEEYTEKEEEFSDGGEEDYTDDDYDEETGEDGEDYGEEEEYDEDVDTLYKNYEILSEFYQKHYVDLRILDETCDPVSYPAPTIAHGRIKKYERVKT